MAKLVTFHKLLSTKKWLYCIFVSGFPLAGNSRLLGAKNIQKSINKIGTGHLSGRRYIYIFFKIMLFSLFINGNTNWCKYISPVMLISLCANLPNLVELNCRVCIFAMYLIYHTHTQHTDTEPLSGKSVRPRFYKHSNCTTILNAIVH